MSIPASSPVRSLLVDAIDYAGLFPPAGLSMGDAVGEYARCRGSDEAWALGRFVAPARRLPELAEVVRSAGIGPAPMLVAATIGPDLTGDLAAVAAMGNETALRVDTVEFQSATADAMADALALIPPALQRFAEWPLDQNPVPFVTLLKLRGAGAKFRTGGITADAIPAPDALLQGLDTVVRAAVPFKCTAGLHHPWRGSFRLTYDAGSPAAVMYGYLNVMLATAALMRGDGIGVARQILLDEDPGHLVIQAGTITWQEVSFDRLTLRALRRRGLRSFGSCSFREPMEELAPLVS